LSNILAQKKEIKRMEKAKDQGEIRALEEKARQEAEAQERAVREFELTQAGISVNGGRVGSARTDTLRREGSRQSPTPPAAIAEVAGTGKRGEKRKFSFNEDEVARIAEEERAKARKAIDDERVRSSPSY
jgi:nitric oxide synthase-interacting protein